jgi:tripartite-type tricarboxylate transporter receptor subunit TctC
MGMAGAAQADTADFFKGKQIKFVVGYSPGGGYDTYTRLLANHLGKHIPGNPDVIVTNMPGGGSLKAANYTYNVAPKDGTHIGVFSIPAAVEPLLGRENAKYDALKFNYLGNMYVDTHSCVTSKSTSIRSLKDVTRSGDPVVFGATSKGSYGNMHARVLQSMAGANVKIVLGYRGIKGVGKALQSGEIAAACAMSISTLASSFRSQMESGEFVPFVQFGKEKNPYFGNATHFYSMVKSDEDRVVTDFFFSQSAIARPSALPPGVPADRVKALQGAFHAALKDEALLAEAKRIGIGIIPESPDAVLGALKTLYATPPAVLAKVKEIMGRK